MDDERPPEPEPRGTLVPPPSHPPTALATAAPVPPRRWPDESVETRGIVARAIDRTFDALDQIGDSIADAVGLR